MEDALLIKNVTVVNPDSLAEGTSVSIHGGLIRKPAGTGAARTIDAEGLYALPGFIDVHIQGAGGYDLSDPDPRAIPAVLSTCARFGVTGLLATTIYRTDGANAHLPRLAAEAEEPRPGCSRVLGLHIEGPFLSLEKQGMIFSEYITGVDLGLLDEILELCGGRLRMMTIAPEQPGALEAVYQLVQADVTASFGHSNATYEETCAGIDAGITHATHLFNAMAGMHHREPGPLPALLEHEEVTAQVISDGVHLQPPVVRLAWRELGPRRTCLITDGIAGMGLPDGQHECNQYAFEVRDGTCFYANGKLIGTALGLSELAGRFKRFTGAELTQLAAALSTTPAATIGLSDRKGRIAPGYDADLVLCDGNLNVRSTIVGGEIVYETDYVDLQ